MYKNCCYVEKCYEKNDPCTVWVPKKRCKCNKCKSKHRYKQ